jgi:outer membrane protein
MRTNNTKIKKGLDMNSLMIILLFSFIALQSIYPQESSLKNNGGKLLSLNDCISIALENNHKIKASNQGIEIANSQKKQAESGYYPQLSLNAIYTLMDKDPLFVMPSFKLSLPPLLPGVNLGEIEVPRQDALVMDKQNINAELQLTYPLYTGGRISSINKQAEHNYEISVQESRKTIFEVKYDVKRFYYAFVLAANLHQLGQETYEKLNATLSLTESLYRNGSGRVTKMDYLKNKLFVDQVNTIITELSKNKETSKEALAFTIGMLPADFEIAEHEIPYLPVNVNVEALVLEAYKNNPEWLKVNSAVEVFNAKIDEAKSGYFPNVGLFANLNQTINSYKYGFVNKNNKTLWTVGIGLEIPIFSGFRTNAEVGISEAELRKIKEEKMLLHDALILQIKKAYFEVISSAEQLQKILEAKKTAEENTSLTERAFYQDMAEASDLVEAQIMEAVVSAQYQKSLYDFIDAQAKLDFIIGK